MTLKKTIPSFNLDRAIFYEHQFYFHQENKPLGYYLSITLPKEPIAQLRKSICEHYKVDLKHRDEAHITVISPFEYEHYLQPHISPTKLLELAQEHLRLPLGFEIIGMGCVTKRQKNLISFFVLINAPLLFSFRDRLLESLKQKTKKSINFSPSDYYPHITIGFNHRDLHKERDDIIKDRSSIISNLILT